ncbi:hypothetical protein [Bacteroides ihuae]|uniref:hypothetical protein n=1 Tax=Bacteroides ihuae TaxID=1852362 RepID=UPI00111480BA|nr:hypothetical protein [Bacteroides ihuae]
MKKRLIDTMLLTERYDSLQNIDISNVRKHIGQTIYLRENNFSKERGGYSHMHLYTVPKFDGSNYPLYKAIPYKNNNNIMHCSYDQLKCKSFLVNKIISGPESSIWALDKGKACIELIETISKDTVYLYYNDLEQIVFSLFLTQGYFEKMKQVYTGKDYIYVNNRSSINKEKNGLRSINDGSERADIPTGVKLKCVDIAVKEGGDNEIIAIMDNPKYGKSFVWLDDIAGTDISFNKFETLEKHKTDIADKQKMVKKYGQQKAKLIIEGKVEIGFNKQMCRESWGEPDNINKTIGGFGTYEQWVYGEINCSYLYFENGLLTSIQN